MRQAISLVFALALSAVLIAQTRTAKTLDIYVIDVEGGNSQLYVSPSGESVLIDTGNAGAAAVRDADRIMAAVNDAGLKQIDHLITTHYHGDHVGGLLELATRVPILEFIDHGPNVQPAPNIDPIMQQVRGAVRKGEAQGRETWRHSRRRRIGLAHRDGGRARHHHSATRCRGAESLLRRLYARMP